jgi:hypothetical protein
MTALLAGSVADGSHPVRLVSVVVASCRSGVRSDLGGRLEITAVFDEERVPLDI